MLNTLNRDETVMHFFLYTRVYHLPETSEWNSVDKNITYMSQ